MLTRDKNVGGFASRRPGLAFFLDKTVRTRALLQSPVQESLPIASRLEMVWGSYAGEERMKSARIKELSGITDRQTEGQLALQ